MSEDINVKENVESFQAPDEVNPTKTSRSKISSLVKSNPVIGVFVIVSIVIVLFAGVFISVNIMLDNRANADYSDVITVMGFQMVIYKTEIMSTEGKTLAKAITDIESRLAYELPFAKDLANLNMDKAFDRVKAKKTIDDLGIPDLEKTAIELRGIVDKLKPLLQACDIIEKEIDSTYTKRSTIQMALETTQTASDKNWSLKEEVSVIIVPEYLKETMSDFIDALIIRDQFLENHITSLYLVQDIAVSNQLYQDYIKKADEQDSNDGFYVTFPRDYNAMANKEIEKLEKSQELLEERKLGGKRFRTEYRELLGLEPDIYEFK